MEDMVSGLASTLGRLRRSPGRDEDWVIKVLAELERSSPEEYDYLQQRLDFVTRLGELAGISETRVAAASVGLLFETLAALGPAKGNARPARPWIQYLDRNGEWLAPSLGVSRAIRQPGWGDCADRSEAVVAKVAKIFVGETYTHHPGLLSALEIAAEEAGSASVERIVTALRSEEGQQLCDRHMRLRGQHWVLSPTDLRESLRILKRAPSERAVAPTARAAPSGAGIEEKSPDSAERRRVAVATATSANFQRRKQALRASTSSVDQVSLGGGGEIREQVGEAVNGWEAPTTASAEPEPAAADEPETPDEEQEPAVSVSGSQPRDQQSGQEEEMQISNEQPELRLTETIQALRSRVDQMERMAGEAREILATLGPKLEEFSAWADELEAVVRRRSGRTETKDTAA